MNIYLKMVGYYTFILVAAIVTLPECATLRKHFWEAIVSGFLF